MFFSSPSKAPPRGSVITNASTRGPHSVQALKDLQECRPFAPSTSRRRPRPSTSSPGLSPDVDIHVGVRSADARTEPLPFRLSDSALSELTFQEIAIFVGFCSFAYRFALEDKRVMILLTVWAALYCVLFLLMGRRTGRSNDSSKRLQDQRRRALRLSDIAARHLSDSDFEFEELSRLTDLDERILQQRVAQIGPTAAVVDLVRSNGHFASYRLSVRDGDGVLKWEVWHRFSDFSQLRKNLGNLHRVRTAASWTAPSLPAKSLRRNLDDKYLNERKELLNRFVQELLQSPEVRASAPMRAFLQFAPLDANGRPISDNSNQATFTDFFFGRQNSSHATPGNGEDDEAKSKLSSPLIKGSRGTPGKAPPAASEDTADAPPAAEERESVGLLRRQSTSRMTTASDAAVAAACEELDTNPDVRSSWEDGRNAHNFQVRGLFYTDDHVKVHAGPAVGTLIHVSNFKCDLDRFPNGRIDHVACYGKAKAIIDAVAKAVPSPPMLFIVNIQVPGNPAMSLVMYFALPVDYEERDLTSDAAKFRSLIHRYFEDMPISATPPSTTADSTDGECPASHFRNQRFKLIPMIDDGPWMVKQAVGSKPTLLGQKLTQRYFRGKHYVETDVHVGSSVVANRIVGLCRGYSKSLSVVLGFTLEGRAEDELPEKLVGVSKFHRMDVEQTESLF